MQAHSDQKTTDYFDNNTPEYSIERYLPFLDSIKKLSTENASIADIGCGTGNILALISHKTGIDNLTGIDISDNYLQQARENTGCTTFNASVLDQNFSEIVTQRFDFVVVGAVLHHLIDSSRDKSRQLAINALKNAIAILKPGGHLILLEPIFSPKISMDLVFYVKKLVSKFTSGRIGLFGYWNNIGEPVVSYYDRKQLFGFMAHIPNCKLVYEHYSPHEIALIMRLSGIHQKGDITLLFKKLEV